MSCKFSWNFYDYKINQNDGEEVDVAVLTVNVQVIGIVNDQLSDFSGGLVLDTTKTKFENFDDFQENYNIVYSTNDSKTLGSIYVVTFYSQEKSPGLQTQLKSITGTVISTGIFSEFNNGTAIIEYDNVSGERQLSLYVK
jgi:hypothetical protein